MAIEDNVIYGISKYSVDVQVPAATPNFFDYLLNITTPNGILHIHNLSYNINYSFNIVAANCFGIETTTQLAIMQGKTNSYPTYKYFLAGCDVPPSPQNGNIRPYNSTEEDAVFQFQCPNEKWTMSQCVHTSWLPDPMDINCSLPLTKVDIEHSLRPSKCLVSYQQYLTFLNIEPYVYDYVY